MEWHETEHGKWAEEASLGDRCSPGFAQDVAERLNDLQAECDKQYDPWDLYYRDMEVKAKTAIAWLGSEWLYDMLTEMIPDAWLENATTNGVDATDAIYAGVEGLVNRFDLDVHAHKNRIEERNREASKSTQS